MLLVVGLTGLVFLLGVAALSVAYLVLPGGRFCPRCGEATRPVRLRPWLRPLRRLLHWRWCVDCGWEGLGRPPRASAPREHVRRRRLHRRRS